MPRRVLEGNVVSDKTDKTITVLVERRFMHPLYKKYIRKTDRYAAHDAANQFKVGDRVSIIECPPISKTKRWTVLVDGQPVSAPKAPKAKAAAPTKKEDKKPAAKKSPVKKPAAEKSKAKPAKPAKPAKKES